MLRWESDAQLFMVTCREPCSVTRKWALMGWGGTQVVCSAWKGWLTLWKHNFGSIRVSEWILLYLFFFLAFWAKLIYPSIISNYILNNRNQQIFIIILLVLVMYLIYLDPPKICIQSINPQVLITSKPQTQINLTKEHLPLIIESM